jgi:hypothetical protein
MFRSVPTLAIVALVALAGPVHSQATPASAPSADPKCSRNSDDIKSAIVVQNASGEFCEGGAQDGSGMADRGGAGAANNGQTKISTKLSASEFQALRNKVIKDNMFYCNDIGIDAKSCRQAIDLTLDRQFVLYYRKCERQKIDLARCDAELVEALAFQWY